jgi:Cu/Ag efflux protein CusF
MKKAVVVFVVVMLVMGAAAAFAAELSGTVTAVDPENGTLSLSSGDIDVGFDCESGSLISDVKVGDQVTVTYDEQDGRKVVSAVAKKRAQVGC